ncbi:tetratricopeptide repeat protein [Mariniflexile fucanivorans]|uniref:histidine kinase n=1 Tax=Mariniflexile fucanivorans TaxID=264023 RepID=A0A4R1RQU1_9FLAO|nr:sensor histidine kinase [Mariniflexile fucanivorans]TCL68619.1 tetratricopeptide repeat protein [Mariniflexile fucanivorans]
MKKLILSIFLIIYSFGCFSQSSATELDSLKTILKKQKKDQKFSTLIDISNIYARIDLDSSKLYANKAYKLSEKIGNDSLKIKALMFLGHTSWERGNYAEAITNFKKSLAISTVIKDTTTIADAYNGLGIVYSKLGNLNTSISYYFKTLKMYEKLNDSLGVGATYLNIAWDYRKLKEYTKSINYNNKSLEIYTNLKDSLHMAMVNNNIAGSLNELGDYEKSLKFSNISKLYFKKLQYERYTAYPITNIAISYDSLHNYNEAKKNYLKAIQLHTLNKEPYELAFLNNALANLNYNLKDYKKAALIGEEAFRFAEEVSAIEFMVSSSKTLARTYEKLNDFNQSNKYLKLYIKFNDSIISTEKLKAIAEIETKYQTEKKEKEILSQRANIAEKELHINQKNTQILGLVILAIVVAILGYLLFNQQKLKNKQLQKENELKEALIKIENQNKLQEQRLTISRDLHDNIGAQLTFIISSIDNLQYGFKITNEKLTNKLSSISEFTKETIYELRDTIWAMNKSEISMEDLQVRISNFIDKGKIAATGIDFNFNVDKSISEELKFTSVSGMNIYRIVQEAINNAVKYADAKTITVNFIKRAGTLKINIIDDGKGFDINITVFGNGLNNMKKRALEIGSNLHIETQIHEGTTITFEV